MSEYEKSIIIKADVKTIYQACIEHFTALGYKIKRASQYGYIEFKWRRRYWAIHQIYTWHNLNIAIQKEGVSIIFRFISPALTPYSKRSKKVADEYIASLVTKIYQKQALEKKHPKRICPKCKREMPWDAKICPYCGYKF